MLSTKEDWTKKTKISLKLQSCGPRHIPFSSKYPVQCCALCVYENSAMFTSQHWNVVLQELVSPVGSLKQEMLKEAYNDGKKRIKFHKFWQNVCGKWWNVGAVGSWLAWQVGIVQFKGVEGSTFPACLKSRKLSQRAQKHNFDTSTLRQFESSLSDYVLCKTSISELVNAYTSVLVLRSWGLKSREIP